MGKFSFSFGLIDDGSGGSEKKKKHKEKTSEFKSNSKYFITISELMYHIKKSDTMEKSYKINTDLIRAKTRNGELSTEYHKGIKVKYLACVVDKGYVFDKLDRRGVEKEEHATHVIYYIPIYLIASFLGDNISRLDQSVSNDLTEITVFRYTGPEEMLTPISIFNLAYNVFITDEKDISDAVINVVF